jgi:Tfp pilus assembly protein PilF
MIEYIVQEYFARACEKINNGEFEDAITYCTKAIAINPNHACIYQNRGVAKQLLGNFVGAIEDYNISLKIDPNQSETLFNRGCSSFYLGNDNEAVEDLTMAIGIRPNYSKAYFERGRANYNLGSYDKAIVDFTKVIKLEPNYADGYYFRGLIYATKIDEPEKAQKDWDVSNRIDPYCSLKYQSSEPPKQVIYSKEFPWLEKQATTIDGTQLVLPKFNIILSMNAISRSLDSYSSITENEDKIAQNQLIAMNLRNCDNAYFTDYQSYMLNYYPFEENAIFFNECTACYKNTLHLDGLRRNFNERLIELKKIINTQLKPFDGESTPELLNYFKEYFEILNTLKLTNIPNVNIKIIGCKKHEEKEMVSHDFLKRNSSNSDKEGLLQVDRIPAFMQIIEKSLAGFSGNIKFDKKIELMQLIAINLRNCDNAYFEDFYAYLLANKPYNNNKKEYNNCPKCFKTTLDYDNLRRNYNEKLFSLRELINSEVIHGQENDKIINLDNFEHLVGYYEIINKLYSTKHSNVSFKIERCDKHNLI